MKTNKQDEDPQVEKPSPPPGLGLESEYQEDDEDLPNESKDKYELTCACCGQRQHELTIMECGECHEPTCSKCMLHEQCKGCQHKKDLAEDAETINNALKYLESWAKDNKVEQIEEVDPTNFTQMQLTYTYIGERVQNQMTCPVDNELKEMSLQNGMLKDWGGKKYTGDILPFDSMDEDMIKYLAKKYKHMPEEFYTKTDLQVVTPWNIDSFLEVHERWAQLNNMKLEWHLQEQWSGSGRTSHKATRRNLKVGFPIDARYGWDLSNAKHRAKIDKTRRVFHVRVTLSSPDCHLWSRACRTMDKKVKADGREAQKPMLEWLHKQNDQAAKKDDGYINENPETSEIWKESTLNNNINITQIRCLLLSTYSNCLHIEIRLDRVTRKVKQVVD